MTCIITFIICSFIWKPTVEIQSCITVLTFDPQTAELQTHFGPASECEGAEKEDEVDEEEVEFGPVLAPQADDSGVTADPVQSAVSPLHCAQSQEHQRSHHQLGAQLGRLKQETSRYDKTKQKKTHARIEACSKTTGNTLTRSHVVNGNHHFLSLRTGGVKECVQSHTDTHPNRTHARTNKNVTNATPPGLHVMPRSSNSIRQWDQSQTSTDLWHI